MNDIRVFVIEDDHLIQTRLSSTQNSHYPKIDIVGATADYNAANETLKRLSPHVVALNKDSGHLHFLQILHWLSPKTRALVCLSTENEDAEVLWRSGAAGICTDEIDPENLRSAIITVAQGHSWLEQPIAQYLRSRAKAHREAQPAATDAQPQHIPALTEREMNVLRLLANGSRNREIASELYTSVSTIKGDIARILSKLGVDDRVEAAVYATKHGLI
jgi:DNA-binding NarL/FixJ family response regulator